MRTEAEIGEQIQFTAFEQGTDCFGSPYYYQIDNDDVDWDSSDDDIATVSDMGLVTIVGVGDVEIDGDWWVNVTDDYGGYCPLPLSAHRYGSFLKSGKNDRTYGTQVQIPFAVRTVNLVPDCEACYTRSIELGSDIDLSVKPVIDSITPTKGSIGGNLSVSINGSGFRPTTTIVPIPGITTTITDRFGSTAIVADFTISGNTSPGNNTVKVTAGSSISNGVNLFVQKPHRARIDQLDNTVVVYPGPGDIINAGGQVLRTGICGAYRNVTLTIVDQNSEELDLGSVSGLTVTEILSNFNSPEGFPQPVPITTLTNNLGAFYDTQAAAQPPPCPAPFSYSLTQGFKVVVDSVDFHLTTENHIAVSNQGSGLWNVNITTVVP